MDATEVADALQKARLALWRAQPIEYLVNRLGVRRETIHWSLLPEYKNHTWDGDIDPLLMTLDAIAKGSWAGIESATGVGKAQPLDTPILTPDGWRYIGDVQAGEMIIGGNGKPVEVLAVYPQGEKLVYRLTFNDGSSTRTCDEHLWTVRTTSQACRERSFVIKQTSELRKMINRDWQIPMILPIQFDEKQYEIDPYVIGVLLGDAGMTMGLVLSSADQFIIDEIAKRTGATLRYHSQYDYGVTFPAIYRTHKNDGTFIKSNPILNILEQFGLRGLKSKNKFIPREYLFGSVQQRLALLQGLMDTDGGVGPVWHAEFSSVSERLADGVVELTRSLGGVALKHKRPNHYRVSVKLPQGMNPFRLPRKANRYKMSTKYLPKRILQSIKPAGSTECVCIHVDSPDGLYVTEDYIVTHNTYIGACLTLWFLECWYNSRVIIQAPKEKQVELHLWREINMLWPTFGRGTLMTKELRMDPRPKVWAAEIYAAGVSSEEVEASARRAQGFHAEHMLIICEETPGIHQAVMTALQNCSGAPHNIIVAFGNPDHQGDALHDFCKLKRVKPIRISAFDHPNIVLKDPNFVPGAASEIGLSTMLDRYNGNEQHPLWLSRAKGICPSQSRHSLIRWEWCERAARRRPDQAMPGPPALGVDVANSETGDYAAIAEGRGALLLSVDEFPCPNASALASNKVYVLMQQKSVAGENVGVDGVGVGASTVNKLAELGADVVDIQSGAAQVEIPDSRMVERFNNLRSQGWWLLAKDLQNLEGGLVIPYDKELFTDLCTPTWETRGGKIIVESKESMRKRLGRSPNKGDAMMYWNLVRRGWLQPKASEGYSNTLQFFGT